MKIGIIHITDVHFTIKTSLEKKVTSLVRAATNDFAGVGKVYIIISGDIAYSGRKEEYEKAWSFLSVVKQFLSSELKNIDIKFVIVPGNHDCNFDYNTQLRKAVLQGMSYSTIGDDTSVIDQCLTVQKDFWEFYGRYHPIPSDRLFYTVRDVIDGKSIVFNCINTAFVSQYNEQPGGLFFPAKNYDITKIDKGDISFGVWHHPPNWFNPNTIENNKAEFQAFIEAIASTHFLGHEHYHSAHLTENSNTHQRINVLSGELFNDDKKQNKSGFQTITLDLDLENGVRKVYNWQKELYEVEKEKAINLPREEGRMFVINDQFSKSLDEVKVPLVIETKKDFKLSDIFVFQDLESSFRDNNNLETYFSSSKLLETEQGVFILDGESQVGKTSLMSMLFLKFYERGMYPILLKGRDITELNLEKIVKRAFKFQYKDGSSFDKFIQLRNERKIILIDDFQDSVFGLNAVKQFFEELRDKFHSSFVTYDSASSILSALKSDVKSIRTYTIKPLGFKKRNELIERFLALKNNPLTYTESTFFNEVKDMFNNVQGVLGDKLMPPYPIYILSIIQALQYKPLKNETSFGYCYQTLIHYSLTTAGVENDDLDSYFNFLTELSYDFLVREIEVKPHSDMAVFFADYAKKFISPGYETIMSILKKSKLIKSDNNGISFCYNYILYYLSAKKISDIMHTNEGQQILSKLFGKLEQEKNANVLVFVTHHSKDVSFIESSLISLMSVLDQVIPISLKKDDPYYNDIASFVQKIKNDIIDPDRNKKDEREKMLLESDAAARQREMNANADFENDAEIQSQMLPFLKSFRAIEIVGQIIKNRRGSIEITQLTSLVEELYTTGFRTVMYYNEILNSAKQEIIENVIEKIDEGDTKKQIEDRISNMLQFISFKMCLGVFIKLTEAAGNKELKRIYSDVAGKLNTPAAKILTFGINLSYSTLNIKQLSELADELKDNIVALRLLKARVRGYVYNRDVDYDTKQRIASILKMELTSKPRQGKPH